MRVLSLFAGAGGFDLGAEAAGARTVAACEIDPKARAVFRRHWPEVWMHDDVRTLTGQMVVDAVGQVDLVTFGSPCQDLSIAGRRAGLAGEQSALFYEATRIIRELDRANAPIRWAIWENVPGALSSNAGRDFGEVLDDLADAGAVGIEWTLLDAQFFGVPQRRRRVFMCAWFDPRTRPPDPLFPVAPGGQGNPATGGETEDNDAGFFEGGAPGRGQSDDRMTSLPPLAGTVCSNWSKGHGPVIPFDMLQNPVVTATVNTNGNIAVSGPTVGVRRITPRECERLMGWPDDHTRWGVDGNEMLDRHRYRMCGNGVVAPVAKWVVERVMEVS